MLVDLSVLLSRCITAGVTQIEQLKVVEEFVRGPQHSNKKVAPSEGPMDF